MTILGLLVPVIAMKAGMMIERGDADGFYIIGVAILFTLIESFLMHKKLEE